MRSNHSPKLFHGNYGYRAQQNLLSEEEAKAQFKYAFPFSCTNESTFEIGYFNFIDNSRALTTLLSVLKYKLLKCNSLATVYYTHKADYDLSKRYLDELNLILYDLSLDLRHKSVRLLTVDDVPESVKARIAALSTIVIFSNEQKEIQTLCDIIKDICHPKPAPILFISHSHFDNNIDSDSLNANIVDIINYANVASEKKAMEWWGELRTSLMQIAALNQTQPAKAIENPDQQQEEKKATCIIS